MSSASPAASAARTFRRNASAPGGSKLPMFEPRNSTSVRPRAAPLGDGLGEARFVRRLVRHDVDVVRRVQRGERAAGQVERRRRDVDRGARSAGVRRARPASISVASFSPLPGPSSTSVDTGSALREDLAAARASSRSRSARVMPYHGSWQIASNSAEPERVVEVARRQLARRRASGSTRRRSRTARASRPAGVADGRSETSRRRMDSAARNQLRNVGRSSSRAVAGDAPFMTNARRRRSRPSIPGTTAIARNPGNGANVVLVHSQPLPTRSSTPQALAPAGWLPAGWDPSSRNRRRRAPPSARRRPTDGARSPAGDPNAARWNSASVGSRAPRQRAYAAPRRG